MNKNGDSAACHHKSPTREADAGARKVVLFRCCMIWENGGLPSQRPSHLSAEAHSSYWDREGRAFLLSINLNCFWHAWSPIHSSFQLSACWGAYPFIFLSFGLLGPYPIHISSFPPAWVLSIHISSFWWLSIRTYPCCYLDQWGRLPSALTVYSNIIMLIWSVYHIPDSVLRYLQVLKSVRTRLLMSPFSIG